MSGGAFTPATRQAIIDANLGVCAGCRRPVDEVHHRRPRGMGGTSNTLIGEPFNGVGLCRACHTYAETHRETGRLLGWLVPHPSPDTPWWTTIFGWCTWTLATDSGRDTWLVQISRDPPTPAATQAVREHRRWVATRAAPDSKKDHR